MSKHEYTGKAIARWPGSSSPPTPPGLALPLRLPFIVLQKLHLYLVWWIGVIQGLVEGVLKVSGHALQSFTGGNVVYGHGERSAQAVGLGAGYPTYNLVDASAAAPAGTEKFERRDEDALAQGYSGAGLSSYRRALLPSHSANLPTGIETEHISGEPAQVPPAVAIAVASSPAGMRPAFEAAARRVKELREKTSALLRSDEAALPAVRETAEEPAEIEPILFEDAPLHPVHRAPADFQPFADSPVSAGQKRQASRTLTATAMEADVSIPKHERAKLEDVEVKGMPQEPSTPQQGSNLPKACQTPPELPHPTVTVAALGKVLTEMPQDIHSFAEGYHGIEQEQRDTQAIDATEFAELTPTLPVHMGVEDRQSHVDRADYAKALAGHTGSERILQGEMHEQISPVEELEPPASTDEGDAGQGRPMGGAVTEEHGNARANFGDSAVEARMTPLHSGVNLPLTGESKAEIEPAGSAGWNGTSSVGAKYPKVATSEYASSIELPGQNAAGPSMGGAVSDNNKKKKRGPIRGPLHKAAKELRKLFV